jgi:hypothetical protein
MALNEVVQRMAFQPDGTVIVSIRDLPRAYFFRDGMLRQAATFHTDKLPGGIEEKLVKKTSPSLFWTWHVFHSPGEEFENEYASRFPPSEDGFMSKGE